MRPESLSAPIRRLMAVLAISIVAPATGGRLRCSRVIFRSADNHVSPFLFSLAIGPDAPRVRHIAAIAALGVVTAAVVVLPGRPAAAATAGAAPAASAACGCSRCGGAGGSAARHGARAGQHRRRCRAGDRRGGQHFDLAERRRACHRTLPASAARFADGGVLRRLLQEPSRPRRRRTSDQTPRRVNSLGSGFIIDAAGHHRHQQSRHRRRRRDHRHPQRRHQLKADAGRQGQQEPISRCCGSSRSSRSRR